NGRIRGPVVVPWQGGVTFRFDFSADDRRRLPERVGAERAEVVLVAYTEHKDNENLESALDTQEQAAGSPADVLGKTGIPHNRIRIMSIGPVAQFASHDRQGNRVEVVVIRRKAAWQNMTNHKQGMHPRRTRQRRMV